MQKKKLKYFKKSWLSFNQAKYFTAKNCLKDNLNNSKLNAARHLGLTHSTNKLAGSKQVTKNILIHLSLISYFDVKYYLWYSIINEKVSEIPQTSYDEEKM